MHLSVFLFREFAQSQWRAQHSLKNMTEPASAFDAATQVCDSWWTWGQRFPVAA